MFFCQTLKSGDKGKSLDIIIPSPEDKEKRKEIHEIVKKHLAIFDSETVPFSR